MTRAHRVRAALAVLVAAAAVAAASPLGCRQILGIEDRGDDALTCDAYCSTVASACTGDKLQYISTDACMGLCATFPVGTIGDMSGNTLGCRINEANAIINTGEGDCAAAGPGGNDICGTNCDAFCDGVALICPSDFKTALGCEIACAKVPDATCPEYFVQTDVVPNIDSIQCRLYHLTAATLDPTEHCPHTLGEDFCVPVADGGIPCTGGEGGADGG
jgi:hypothetical protein